MEQPDVMSVFLAFFGFLPGLAIGLDGLLLGIRFLLGLLLRSLLSLLWL